MKILPSSVDILQGFDGKSLTETHLGQTYCVTSKLVCEVRCSEYCPCISIFAHILKLLAQIASMFSLKYFCSQYF